MEKHGSVTIDFSNLGGDRKDMKIPFHLTTRELINELVLIYNYEDVQEQQQFQSFKALISEKFVSGKETLLDAGIKDGEILLIIK